MARRLFGAALSCLGAVSFGPAATICSLCQQQSFFPLHDGAGLGAASAAILAAAGKYRRAPSAPEVVRRGAAPSLSLSLTSVRERSAERRYVLVCTLRCRVPCGHAASRRSTCGVFHPGTVLSGPNRGTFIPRDPGGFRRPSSEPYWPSFEGSPS